MALTPGRISKLEVSADDATYTQVGRLNSIDGDIGYDSADVTSFGDYAKAQYPTLSKFSGSASGRYDHVDAGQVIIMAAIDTPALLWVRAYFDGTHFRKCQCTVNVKIGAKEEDVPTFEFSFESAGGARPVAG